MQSLYDSHQFARILMNYFLDSSMYVLYVFSGSLFSVDQDVPQTSAAATAAPQTQTRIHSLSLTDPIGDEDDE